MSEYDLQTQSAIWDRRFAGFANVDYRHLPVSGKTREVGEFLLGVGASTVLDIGCGVGRWCMHFAHLGLNPTGLDISSEAITQAKAWASDEGMALSFLVAPATALPLADASFSAVVASAVLDHLPLAECRAAMAEIRRVLRPGGALFVSFDGEDPEPAPHDVLPDGTWQYTEGDLDGTVWRYWSDDEIRTLLVGFEALAWQTVGRNDRWICARMG